MTSLPPNGQGQQAHDAQQQAYYAQQQQQYAQQQAQYAQQQYAQQQYAQQQQQAHQQAQYAQPHQTQAQPQQAQTQYVQPQVQYAPQPLTHANYATNRSLLKYILLGIITLGIYAIWVTARAGEDLNAIAGRWDNRRSMNYWLMALIITPITFGIGYYVWWHKVSDRIGNEQRRRGLQRTVAASDFWLWGVLGILIIVGPFIFAYKWLHAMNGLCADFNARG